MSVLCSLRVSEDPTSCGPPSHPPALEATERASHLLWNTQLYILYHQDQLAGNTHTHTLETPLHLNLSVIVGFERKLIPEARPAEASPGFAVL